MSALRDAVGWLAAPVFGGYLGMVTLGGLDALALHVCPAVEATVSPVVRITLVDEISHDRTRVCFALHFEKLRAAVPVKYAFFAEAELSDRIPLAAYPVDAAHHRVQDVGLATHPAGQKWTSRYCFDLPQTLVGLAIHVTGVALFRRHPLYMTPARIPEFDVAASS